MAKKADTSFRDILLKIKKRDFAPIYILQGDEPFYLDKIASALENTVVAPDDRDFNMDVIYGADADADMVMGSARQFPMMSDRRLVILKEAQAMDKAKIQLEKLEEYYSHPTTTTVLVVVFKSEKTLLSAKGTKAVTAAGGVIFKSPKLRDYELDGPITDYLAEKHLGIDQNARELLKEYVGNDLSKLFSEIDKLIVASGGKLKRITTDDIERNIGISKEYNNFELVNALSQRQYGKALKIVEFYRRNPTKNPTVVTAATIFNHFQKVVIAHFLADKSEAGIMQALQLKSSFAFRSIRDTMQLFNPAQSVAVISAIADFDCKSKGIGSVANEFDLLQELVFKITTC